MDQQGANGNALDDLLNFLKEQAPVFGTKANPYSDAAGGIGGGLLGAGIGGLAGGGNGALIGGALGAAGGVGASKLGQQLERQMPMGQVRYDVGNPMYSMSDPTKQGMWYNPTFPGAIKAARSMPGMAQSAGNMVGNTARGIADQTGQELDDLEQYTRPY